MNRGLRTTLITIAMLAVSNVFADPFEIYCTIRSSGSNLDCQTVGKDRRTMTAEDISNFIDAGQVAAYITLRSQKKIERTFMIDPKSPQYKHLADIRGSSISEIAKTKSDLFNEIEKRVIKTSNELDAQAAGAELVLWDPGLSYDKFKREQRTMLAELEGFRKSRDKACNSTPAFEQVSKVNAKLQKTISDIVFAFQTPGTCMANFKVLKEQDGSIDLRQLESVVPQYRESCRK